MTSILLISMACPTFLFLALICRRAVTERRAELAEYAERRSPDFDFFLIIAAYEFAAIAFAGIGVLAACAGIYQLIAYGI